MADLWYAMTRTWEGIGIGTHWYCTLRGPVKDQATEDYTEGRAFEVWYVMTAADAKALSTHDFKEKPGNPSGRFRNKQACFGATIAAFKWVAEEGDILLHDDSTALNPSEVLVGPESLAQVWVDAERETPGREGYAESFYDRWRDELAKAGAEVKRIKMFGSVPIGNEIICALVGDEWRVDEDQTDLEENDDNA